MLHDPKNFVLVGVKKSVLAIAKNDGRILWQVELPGSVGGYGFVNLTSDDSLVYAHTAGRLHAIELKTGKLLWTNELSGFGYGLATMHVPGQPSNANATLAEYHFQQERSNSSNSTTTSS